MKITIIFCTSSDHKSICFQFVHMAALNISTWTDNSRFVENVSIESFNHTANDKPLRVTVSNVVLLCLCVFGLPGNLLVIAVYIRQLTSSTRVYMFALAVADSCVCVCGIVLTTAWLEAVTGLFIVRVIINLAILSSAFLLVCVAIERAVAVTWPYTFNMEAHRAKKTLIYINLLALVFTTMQLLAASLRKEQFNRVFEICTIAVCISTITMCYTIMAVTLLRRRNPSKKYVHRRHCQPDSIIMTISSNLNETRTFSNVESSDEAGTSTMSSKPEVMQLEHSATPCHCRGARSAIAAANIRNVAKQTYKNVTLLFIITAVFIACMLPQWLHNLGVILQDNTRRLFLLNAVVNPFIYGVASVMFREDVRQFFRKTHANMSGSS